MEEGDKVKFELVYYKNMKRLNDISIKYLVAKLGFWARVHWNVMAVFEFMARNLKFGITS